MTEKYYLYKNEQTKKINLLRREPTDNTKKIETRPCNITTDKDGYIIVTSGKKIGKYTVVKELGKGLYGTVVEGSYQNKLYAIKVIKDRKKSIKLSLREIYILKKISNKYIVKLIESFKCSTNQIVMVFPVFSINISEFIKKYDYQFRISEVRIILKQMAQGLSYMHSQNIIHTDLKQENIMFDKDILNDKGRLVNINIKIIDLGNAIESHKVNIKTITSPHYRAPEVILGLEWSYPIDIWAMALICLELYANRFVIEVNSNSDQRFQLDELIEMQPIFGIIEKESDEQIEYSESIEDRSDILFGILPITRRSLEEIVSVHHKKFLDLLKKMFEYDQNKRITAKQILKHPFITGEISIDTSTSTSS